MSVAAKINQVMSKVSNLAKDGTMQGVGNYGYLSEEKITSELHSAFTEAGLVIVPFSPEVIECNTNTNGMRFVLIKQTYRLMDKDEPKEDPIYIATLGEGMDKGDKAVLKAQTACYKYALRQSCMITTGDDPDHTSSEDATKGGKQQQRPQAQKQQPKTQQVAGNGATATDTTDLQNVLKDLQGQKFGNGTTSLAAFNEWCASQKIPAKKRSEYNSAELKAIIKRLEAYEPKQKAA